MKNVFEKYATVLFQGDSVTDNGRNKQDPFDLSAGYPALIAARYQAEYPDSKTRFFNRGWTGNSLIHLIERYERDILALKPAFISIMIGVNNVWRRFDRNIITTNEEFAEQYENLLKRIRRDLPHCDIMLLDPFILPFNEERIAMRPYLQDYIKIIGALADKYADFHVATDEIMNNSQLTAAQLSRDGVHPTLQGHQEIAKAFIAALESQE